jgi:hypothetical protein
MIIDTWDAYEKRGIEVFDLVGFDDLHCIQVFLFVNNVSSDLVCDSVSEGNQTPPQYSNESAMVLVQDRERKPRAGIALSIKLTT